MSGVAVGSMWIPYEPPREPSVRVLYELLVRRLDFSAEWISRRHDRSSYDKADEQAITHKIEEVWPTEHLEMIKTIRENLIDPPATGLYNIKYAGRIFDGGFIDIQDDQAIWGYNLQREKMTWLDPDSQTVLEEVHNDDRGNPMLEFTVLFWWAI
jgi:hypothetical protein